MSPSPVLEPNDVQDVHIALSGLPTDQKIVSAILTGYGGGKWDYNGAAGTWKIVLVRPEGSPTADLYFDPGDFDTARAWNVHITYENGQIVDIPVQGTRSDPDRRMPAAVLQAEWRGQDGQDWTSPGPSVGPDGFQDVHLALSHLSAKIEVKSIRVSVGPPSPIANSQSTLPHLQSADRNPSTAWEFGLNPDGLRNAELFRRQDDPSQADLYFSPTNDLVGKPLTLRLVYTPGQGDSTTVLAGHTNPGLRMTQPAPFSLLSSRITARWLGQDGGHVIGRGDIHTVLRGLPRGQKIMAAALSDPVGGYWVFRSSESISFYVPPAGEEIPETLPLAFQISQDGATADLYFPPYRDESGATMTLRLLLEDGSTTVCQFKGGVCDPYKQGPAAAPTSVTARPGDNLSDLANHYGTIRLTRGKYSLDHPLALKNPITITGEPGAVVEFSQPAGDSTPWLTAIQIGSGTTLEGFAVRFATPIHWAPEDWINGAAVIGTLAPTNEHPDRGINITITNMDIESSPMPAGAPLEIAPRLIRLISATSGRIINNTLKGGVTDVMHGPWYISHNLYRGTMPGTFAYDTFAGHYIHDFVVENNTLDPAEPYGKTWRFCVMTQSGANDVVRGNHVRGIGMRDNDTIPNPNAPEILLTEAYRLHFEGKPSAILDGGRILQIPFVLDSPIRSGNTVAILDGPGAGRWVRIAQPITPTTLLMDEPLPPGSYNISISTGFVGEIFENNTIDTRGSTGAGNFILAGNHFGTRVLNNHFRGARDGFLLFATPTERPNIWGWSHAPFLGGIFEGNVIEDSFQGGAIAVQHSRYIKSSQGRRYMSVIMKNNIFRWTSSFLEMRRQKLAAQADVKDASKLTALRVGEPGALDPGELALTEENTRVQAPPGVDVIGMKVAAAQINGTEVTEKEVGK